MIHATTCTLYERSQLMCVDRGGRAGADRDSQEPASQGRPCEARAMMSAMFRSRLALVSFLGVLALAVVVGSVLILHSSTVAVDGQRHFSLFDDGMITMRYADNLAAGRGLVWNPSERVEGFSSPLWVFVLAAAVAALGREWAVVGIQFLGLLLAICDLVLVALITRRLLRDDEHPDWGALAAVLMTCTCYPIFYWSIMGMETALVVPLLLWATLLSLVSSPGRRQRWALALLWSLACLTRPESVLFVGTAAFFTIIRLRIWYRSWRDWLSAALLFVAPIAAYQLFRRIYYGQWYANSYQLKLDGLGWARRLANGWSYSATYLLWSAPVAVAVALLIWAGRRWPRASGPVVPERCLEFLVLFVVMSVYQIAVGGDAWPPLYRFPAPAVVLLLVAFVVAVLRLGARWPHNRVARAGLVISLLALARHSLGMHAGDAATLTPAHSDEMARNINAGLLIHRLTVPGASMVSFYAGAAPYYARRRAIDPLGRVDAHVARLPAHQDRDWGTQGGMPGHNKYDLDYSLRQKRPTAIVAHDWGVCLWADQDLTNWCAANYRLISWGDVHVLVDNESPLVRRELL